MMPNESWWEDDTSWGGVYKRTKIEIEEGQKSASAANVGKNGKSIRLDVMWIFERAAYLLYDGEICRSSEQGAKRALCRCMSETGRRRASEEAEITKKGLIDSAGNGSDLAS